MRSPYRTVFTAALVSLLSASLGWTGPMEDFKAATAAQERGDYATALRMYQALANQNIPGAQWAMGSMYLEGKGVPRDYTIALKWHRLAADNGHPLSQYEIGAMYDRGLGVLQSQSEAARWFRRSAEQGYGMAQVNLGAMHAVGEGVPQDVVEAYKWFSVAASGGGYLDTDRIRTEAAKRRDAIGARMTAAQRGEGQDRARQWKAKPEKAAIAAVQDLARSQPATPQQPPPQKGSAAEAAASFLLSTCYEALDDISRVRSYARLMKWEVLPPDAKNVLRPIGGGKDYEAWMVAEHGQKFIVSAHKGTFRGKPAEVCQVFTNVPPEPLIASIASKVRIGPPTSAEHGMQRNDIYQLLQHPTGRPALLIVSKSKEGLPATNVGFMGVQ